MCYPILWPRKYLSHTLTEGEKKVGRQAVRTEILRQPAEVDRPRSHFLCHHRRSCPDLPSTVRSGCSSRCPDRSGDLATPPRRGPESPQPRSPTRSRPRPQVVIRSTRESLKTSFKDYSYSLVPRGSTPPFLSFFKFTLQIRSVLTSS